MEDLAKSGGFVSDYPADSAHSTSIHTPGQDPGTPPLRLVRQPVWGYVQVNQTTGHEQLVGIYRESAVVDRGKSSGPW